jgi:hypothetical protein
MIKIKLFEPHIHRNETSFRPLAFIKHELAQVGIELIFGDATSYDFMLVGQASFLDKKKSLQESVEFGLEKISSITGDYILLDGQDSTSLIGSADLFRQVYKNNNCKLFLKSSYLKDFDLYKKGWTLGRMYWGEGEYSVPDIDDMKPKMKLAGFNWLSTIQPQWNRFDYNSKITDVWAFFQYPMGKDVYEHGMLQSAYYDRFRTGLHNKLGQLESKYKVVRMKDGVRIPAKDYYRIMYQGKIVIAAFGYGEMAPRDIETAMFGNILLKNDMNHIWTIPNPYVPNETYIPIKWDWSDIEEKIDYVLFNFKELQQEFVINLRNKYIQENSIRNRVIHFYNLLKSIDNIGVEE